MFWLALSSVLSKLKRPTVTTWWKRPKNPQAPFTIRQDKCVFLQMPIAWGCAAPAIMSCCWFHQAGLPPPTTPSSSAWSHLEAVAHVGDSFCPMKRPPWGRRPISALSSKRFLFLRIFAAPQMLALPGSEEKRRRGGGGMGSQEDAVRKWLVR